MYVQSAPCTSNMLRVVFVWVQYLSTPLFYRSIVPRHCFDFGTQYEIESTGSHMGPGQKGYCFGTLLLLPAEEGSFSVLSACQSVCLCVCMSVSLSVIRTTQTVMNGMVQNSVGRLMIACIWIYSVLKALSSAHTSASPHPVQNSMYMLESQDIEVTDRCMVSLKCLSGM